MRTKLTLAAALLLLLSSCSQSPMEQYLATADSVNFPSPITDIHSPSRKVIHTADLDCRVTDALGATTQTEKWVKNLEGIVVKSDLRNEIVSEKDMPYKLDSLKRTLTYVPTASLEVKVPVGKADSLIALITANAQFIASRSIAQKDVTFDYLSNALKNENSEKAGTPVAISAKVKTTPQALAEEARTKREEAEQVVDRRIANLKMLEDIDYTTLSVKYTQPCQVDVIAIANPKYVTATPLGVRLLMALNNGATILQGLLVALVTVWPLLLVSLCIIILYKRFKRTPQLQK